MQDPEAMNKAKGVANKGFEHDDHLDPRDSQSLPKVAVMDDDDGPDEYVDVDTGKVVKTPTPCCGCRSLDHRFPLEMDEETSYVYREAKYCNLSYTFISSWCMMFFFATVASAGIIAIGFLDKKLIQYQVVGIILTIIFGCFLPVFFVFWVCLQRRAKEVRQEYRSQKNRNLVFQQEMNVSLAAHDDVELAKAKMENQRQARPSPPASPARPSAPPAAPRTAPPAPPSAPSVPPAPAPMNDLERLLDV